MPTFNKNIVTFLVGFICGIILSLLMADSVSAQGSTSSSCPDACQNMTIYTPDGAYRPSRCPLYNQTFSFNPNDTRGFVLAKCKDVHEPPIAQSIILTRSDAMGMPGFLRVQDNDHHYYFTGCYFDSSNKGESGGFNVVATCFEAPAICDLEDEGCEPVFNDLDQGMTK